MEYLSLKKLLNWSISGMFFSSFFRSLNKRWSLNKERWGPFSTSSFTAIASLSGEKRINYFLTRICHSCEHLNKSAMLCEKSCLTHYQTTNFRLFQTERVCRRQFQIWWKWQKVIQTIACYEQFLLFPQRFQKACFPGASKGVTVWEWIKCICKKYW